MKEKIILITNDDGIHAEGIDTLVQVARKYGKIYVIAPDQERSAASHSITINRPLHASSFPSKYSGVKYIGVDGTPVDCVKLALHKILPKKPDLVFSGINFGLNIGQDVLYSGTVAAAMEASRNNCLSFAFSAEVENNKVRFDTSAKVIEMMFQNLENYEDLSASKVVNVNIPHLDFENIKGISNTKVDKSNFATQYEEYQDPRGKMFYWLSGRRHVDNQFTDNDYNYLKKGFVSISSLDNQYTNQEKCKHLEDIIGKI